MIKVIEETVSTESCVEIHEYDHESIKSAKEHIDLVKDYKKCYIASCDPRDVEKRRLMNLSKADVIEECLFAKEMIQKEIEEGVDLYVKVSTKDSEIDDILRHWQAIL